MAFAHVAEVTYFVNAATASIPLPSLNVNEGELIVVGFRWENGGLNDTATITVTDTDGNSYSTALYEVSGASGEDEKVALVWAIADSTTSIVITGALSATRSFRQAWAATFSNAGNVTSGDTNTGNSPTNTGTIDLGNVDADTGDLIIGTIGNYNSSPNVIAGSGYTLSGVTTINAYEYKVAGSTGSHAVDATFTANDTYAGIAIVFRDGVSGLTVSPTGIASGESFGNPTLGIGLVDIEPTGIPTAESFGTAVLGKGLIDIEPAGIISEEAVGTITVFTDAVTLLTVGIPTEEVFGLATVHFGIFAPAKTFDSSYPIRRQLRRSLFHSDLILDERGRAEEAAINDAIVSLGGTTLTPPVDGIVAEPGYELTRTLQIFNISITRVYEVDKPKVINDLTFALTVRGWT